MYPMNHMCIHASTYIHKYKHKHTHHHIHNLTPSCNNQPDVTVQTVVHQMSSIWRFAGALPATLFDDACEEPRTCSPKLGSPKRTSDGSRPSSAMRTTPGSGNSLRPGLLRLLQRSCLMDNKGLLCQSAAAVCLGEGVQSNTLRVAGPSYMQASEWIPNSGLCKGRQCLPGCPGSRFSAVHWFVHCGFMHSIPSLRCCIGDPCDQWLPCRTFFQVRTFDVGGCTSMPLQKVSTAATQMVVNTLFQQNFPALVHTLIFFLAFLFLAPQSPSECGSCLNPSLQLRHYLSGGPCAVCVTTPLAQWMGVCIAT